jgi:hypothetical protein
MFQKPVSAVLVAEGQPQEDKSDSFLNRDDRIEPGDDNEMQSTLLKQEEFLGDATASIRQTQARISFRIGCVCDSPKCQM